MNMQHVMYAHKWQAYASPGASTQVVSLNSEIAKMVILHNR